MHFNIPFDLRGSKVIEIVWYRSKAKLKNTFKPGSPETSGGSRPYAGGLPQEILEMIIAHVPPDTPTLKACSRTCRSWYIVTLPHPRHTVTLYRRSMDRTRDGLVPLQKLKKMGLLPFIVRLRIMSCSSLPPDLFNAKALDYFSALTNVQELGFDELDLHMSGSKAPLYLGYFMPRLRYLALRSPYGTYGQLLHSLGLFPNLDDLKVTYDRCWKFPPLGPVPQSKPLLRGRLTVVRFAGEEFFWRDLSKLCGGLRFSYMHLADIRGGYSRFLLEACSETLETLRIHPTEWGSVCKRGVFSVALACLTHQPTAILWTILEAFDLSNCSSLRSLEIDIVLTLSNYDYGMRFLEGLLSTVTSPVFSDVVFLLQDTVQDYFLQNVLFVAIQDMDKVRPFRLVFRLGKFPQDSEDNRERVKGLIEAQVAKGGLGSLPHPPVIVPCTRAAWSVGTDKHMHAPTAL